MGHAKRIQALTPAVTRLKQSESKELLEKRKDDRLVHMVEDLNFKLPRKFHRNRGHPGRRHPGRRHPGPYGDTCFHDRVVGKT